MKPLIGVTAGEIKNPQRAWSPVVYGQGRTYTDAVIAAGGLPVVIPLTRNRSVIRAIYSKLDGLLFAGGNDVSPALYGEQPRVAKLDFSELRDAVESQLMQLALEDQKPLMGICRGMQLLNVAAGGTLYQDIATDLPAAHNHQASEDARDVTYMAHCLSLAPHSKLSAILGREPIHTNAHHHQAVKQLADGLQAVAWAEDGIIEAIEHPGDPFIFGVQSHPESLEAAAEPRWQKLFAAFVDAASGYADIHSDFELKTATNY